MVFITGDVHGSNDIHKFNSAEFPMQKNLTRSDVVIVCGDLGLVWDDSKDDLYWRRWLDGKPWTTLWIDGNHENFDLLSRYPVEQFCGGRVQKITENVIHLCRGSLFNIEGLKIFAFGGAESHDKKYRKLGKTMWEQEMPSREEFRLGWETLDKAGWKADLVITHTMPEHIQNAVFGGIGYKNNPLTAYFDEIDRKLDFKMWFSGHYHSSRPFDRKHFFIYNDIIKLAGSGFEKVSSSPHSGLPDKFPDEQ